MSQQQKQSKVLLNSAPMIIPVEIANVLGLEQAMLLQQIHYWIQTKLENPQKFQDSKQQGHMWVYKSARQMHEEMPFLGSESKIKRIIAELKQKMILVVDNFNKHPMDKTGWYRINYQALKNAVGTVATIELGQDEPPKDFSEPTMVHDELTIDPEQTNGEGQNDSIQGCSLTQAIPKTTPKTTTEITTEDPPIPSGGEPPKSQKIPFHVFWQRYPLKKDRKKAQKVWDRLPLEQQNLVLLDVPRRAVEDWQWIKDGGQYIPRATTYLNGARWEDDFTPVPSPKQAYSKGIGHSQSAERPLTAGAAQQAKNRDFIQRRLAEVRAQNNG